MGILANIEILLSVKRVFPDVRSFFEHAFGPPYSPSYPVPDQVRADVEAFAARLRPGEQLAYYNNMRFLSGDDGYLRLKGTHILDRMIMRIS